MKQLKLNIFYKPHKETQLIVCYNDELISFPNKLMLKISQEIFLKKIGDNL